MSSATSFTAAVCGCLIAAGCRGEPPVEPGGELPNQVIEMFALHETNSAGQLYMLEAETAYVHDSDQRVEVVRPQVTFYNEEGGVHSVLIADRGTIQSRTEDLVARGNVTVRTEDGTLLRTDSLVWSNGPRIVHTDAPVDISSRDGEIHGQGLVSDAGLSRIQIKSEVRGTSSYDFEGAE